MLIDSHAHAWPRWPYQPPVPDDTQRGSVEQLLWEMDQSGVDIAVLVAADIDRNHDNNDYVAEQALRHPGRLRQLAAVDCQWGPTYHTAGAADRLRAIADHYRPAGVTHYFARAVDDWPLSEEGQAFFAAAEELGLVMSLAGGPAWQPQIREIAGRFPGLSILCHHLAGIHSSPMPQDEALKLVLASLELPNVYVKVSGFAYGSPRPWDFPHPVPIAIVRQLYEAVGARRLCWGSDYPVIKRDRSYSYAQTLECVRSHCPFIPAAEMPWVIGDNLAGLLGGSR